MAKLYLQRNKEMANLACPDLSLLDKSSLYDNIYVSYSIEQRALWPVDANCQTSSSIFCLIIIGSYFHV